MHENIYGPKFLTEDHLRRVETFYDQASNRTTWGGDKYRRLLARYYEHLIPRGANILEVGCGDGQLLALLPNRNVVGIDLSAKQIQAARTRVPHGQFFQGAAENLADHPDLIGRKFDVILISETINFASDVQRIFEQLHNFATPSTRLILNFYNAIWRPILGLLTLVGLKSPQPNPNWLSHSDVRNLLDLGSWEFIKEQPRILLPAPLFGIDRLVNRYIAPFFSWACLTVFQIAKPFPKSEYSERSVSVLIPARNEAGNIRAAVRRTPQMGAWTEIIFVEGNSTDNTWEEIQKVARENPHLKIRTLQQSSKGKGNAVRDGFAVAEGDILMILDADLTMPPEELPKFYDALASGRTEFANGVRLVYPMEDKAMRFLNMCANKFFSVSFSWILGQSVKDTLCGTKVLFRNDYEKIVANRAYFGDFDPFGDFDLLFGANKLNLKIMDIPIRYKERTYGETNIHRWSHGWLLLKMVGFSLKKIKFV